MEHDTATDLSLIVDLNRAQEISEIDTFTERRYKQFARRLRDRTRDVLDIGCNTGRGGAIMKAMRPDIKIIGLDCVPERISALDPSIYDASICTFTHRVLLASDSFDAIVAGEFIEHVPADLVYPTLCEFFRLLRLKGLLLLTTPNPDYLRNKLRGLSVLGGAHLSQHHASSLGRRI